MKKILIADDQLSQRMVLEAILSIKHDVTLFSNGKEVLEYLKTHTPDLIILDVDMPYIDGIKVCERVKQVERLREVPVIILTASKDKDLKMLARFCRADAFVSKPLSGKDFTQTVEKFLALTSVKKPISQPC